MCENRSEPRPPAAEGNYPTDDSFVVFGARAAVVDSETRWDVIEFGPIPPEPIPAVSTWGAAVLTLLTLTTATLVYGRGLLRRGS